MTQKTIYLRPHHLLVLKKHWGKTYKEIFKYFSKLTFQDGQKRERNFTDEATKNISEKFQEIYQFHDNIIKIIKTPDYICKRCNGYSGINCMLYSEAELLFEDKRTFTQLFPDCKNKKQIKIQEMIDYQLPSINSFIP